jgi:acyl-CoA dehydrogenase
MSLQALFCIALHHPNALYYYLKRQQISRARAKIGILSVTTDTIPKASLMTDLKLSDESKEYQNLARDFFQKEVAAKSEKLDQEAAFPLDLYQAAWELGLATAVIPDGFGGLGLSLWDCTVIAEEAGAASGGFAAGLEGNFLAMAPILLAGNEAQKQEYLTRLTTEATLAGYCFPAGSDGSSFPCAGATYRSADGKFYLKAPKIAALNGEQASWYFVLAQEEGGAGFSAFVVPCDLPGIIRGAQLPKLGRRCADICSLQLDNLELTDEHLLGKAGEGRTIVLESCCLSAPIVAAHATGLMRSGLEHSLRYSKERQTFGKPIGKHQAIGFMLADMAKNTECARLMTWKAANLFDNGVRDSVQALAARVFAVDAAMALATEAVQIFGGYGYSREYPVERLMRDAKMMQMMAGSSFELKCTLGEELLSIK